MQTTNKKSFYSTKKQTEFPLSQLQKTAWFLYKLENDSYTDKVSFAFYWHEHGLYNFCNLVIMFSLM